MSTSNEIVWTVGLILGLPVLVVLIGELAERLRRRGSPLAAPVDVVRLWVVPLGVIYALGRVVLELRSESVVSRLVATALLIAIAVASIRTLRIATDALRRLAPDDPGRTPPQLLLALPRLLVLLVTGWLLLSTVWGVAVSNAFAALGVTSLIVSLALQSTISGLASGLLLLADQPFRPGEWIRVGDLEGRVVDVNWRSTRMRDRNGDLLVLPNSQLAGATIVNFDQPERLHRITLPVQVAFSNPPNRAIEMLLAAARSTPGVLAEPNPDVKVTAVDDPLMTYELQVWIDDHTDTPRIRSDLAALVWYWSERLEVPLPSPAQDLYLWDGATVAAEKAEAARGDDQVRHRLVRSALLATLPDADLEQLASSGRRQLFAAGEIITTAGPSRDRSLQLLTEGRATLEIELADGRTVVAADLPIGDLIGVERWDRVDQAAPRVRAVSDCEVVSVDRVVAELVVGRNPGLADAIGHLVAARDRRLERLVRAALGTQEEST